LLSHLNQSRLEDYINKYKLKKFTKNTIGNKEDLLERLKEVKEQGFSIDNEELEEGLMCLGIPIYGYKGQLIASITVSVPRERLDYETREQIIESLKSIGKDISQKLGKS